MAGPVFPLNSWPLSTVKGSWVSPMPWAGEFWGKHLQCRLLTAICVLWLRASTSPGHPWACFAGRSKWCRKTETALALAELLYGGEQFITTLNMSEYQEKHALSRLIERRPVTSVTARAGVD